ncbi:MAG TPA: TM1802 family CRISPR-associated protein, partial [Chitinophagales bacterium]|nr:TM1802 family CRISPR-associated protein [Chitinophagales bacterium]
LHLFNQQTMENVISATHNSVALTPKDFIAQHPAFFDSEYKKGVFLLGCLTQALLNKQKSKLQNDPFSKNLNSLNLDKTDLEKLLPKLINKLREYDVYYHSDLEAQIAQALVTPCTLTKTDISYTFTLGLIMQREFTNQFLQNKKTDDSTKQS